MVCMGFWSKSETKIITLCQESKLAILDPKSGFILKITVI